MMESTSGGFPDDRINIRRIPDDRINIRRIPNDGVNTEMYL